MPARSTVAQADEELKGQIKDLKAQVSSLGNANDNLNKQLGAALKDQKAHDALKGEKKALEARVSALEAENGRLRADVTSARAGGARDAETLAAAKQVADGLKKLTG
jgi:predicted  nucleic acid-binding Zn-ribbon protein